MSAPSPVLVERRGRVALVTLNRPERHNAMSQALRHELSRVFTELGADDALGCIVLTGAGERAFCAGMDLKDWGSGDTSVDPAESLEGAGNPTIAISACPVPVIAAVNGVAVTGGLELMLACDIILASDTARFADTHCRVGIVPGWGLSQKLSRLVGPYRAREISLSGNFIDAGTAAAWGLVNRVLPAAGLLEAALTLAEQIADSDQRAVRAHKRMINEGALMTLEDALAYEARECRAFGDEIEAADIEARRADILKRGRDQTG